MVDVLEGSGGEGEGEREGARERRGKERGDERDGGRERGWKRDGKGRELDEGDWEFNSTYSRLLESDRCCAAATVRTRQIAEKKKRGEERWKRAAHAT